MDLVSILVKILVLGLVFGLVYAILVNTVVPALPAGFGKFVLAVAGLIAILLVLAIVFPGAIGGLTLGAPLLFLGGLRSVSGTGDGAPRAMLVAVTGTGDGSVPTAPPKAPWWLGLVRAWWTFLPALLWVGDYLVSRISAGAIKLPIPDELMLFVSVALPALLGYLKTLKEAERRDAANTLTALGVPIGQTLSAADARKVAS